MISRFPTVIFLLATALTGCQLSGEKPSGAKDGYFTWVDEQGQVRQTPIPGGHSAGQSGGQKQTQVSSSHPEFNLENFPDGNALEARGFIRPGDPEPYFTWRDAQGSVRVSYYQPDTRTAVEKGDIQPPLQLTEAGIYQASTVEETVAESGSRLPETADRFASTVLGLDESEAPFFERWTAACCAGLDRSDYLKWEAGREFGVNLRKSSLFHEFVTGRSHYALVRLPGSTVDQAGGSEGNQGVNDFILRVRSFNKRGMFVPSVAFLDGDFKTLRLVTDLVAEYVPESWSQHGYLRSYIPVFPSRGERWLLIYSTNQDLESQTVIDTRHGPRAIEHQPTGELGLRKVDG